MAQTFEKTEWSLHYYMLLSINKQVKLAQRQYFIGI